MSLKESKNREKEAVAIKFNSNIDHDLPQNVDALPAQPTINIIDPGGESDNVAYTHGMVECVERLIMIKMKMILIKII